MCLGTKHPEKIKLLKLKMRSVENSIMSRLPNLKKAEDIYRKVSITDDYMVEEREEISKKKRKLQMRKSLVYLNMFGNCEEVTKNGLQIKRFFKRQVVTRTL